MFSLLQSQKDALKLSVQFSGAKDSILVMVQIPARLLDVKCEISLQLSLIVFRIVVHYQIDS